MDSEGNLSGKGFILNSSDTIFIEFLGIRKTESGLIYSVSASASLDGEKIPFQLAKQTENSIEFFNPKYPFPQRIVYSLSNDSTIVNYIEGLQEGENVRKNFVYQKIN